ncbi:MAG TPA: 30S ribosomal protein S2, partial [Clostridiales bacterium]|nr:30S ribosomal protein S2 [Clostridiales bacterium]
YVNQRWLGGMLTNFSTIKTRVERLRELEALMETDQFSLLPKKEQRQLLHEKAKLEKYLKGIKDMSELPDAVYIVDPRRENIAVKEARRLEIPIVAIVDTNCDPDEIDYVIPGNDDAIRAVKLITSRLADAVLEGRQIAADRQAEAEAEAASGPLEEVPGDEDWVPEEEEGEGESAEARGEEEEEPVVSALDR